MGLICIQGLSVHNLLSFVYWICCCKVNVNRVLVFAMLQPFLEFSKSSA